VDNKKAGELQNLIKNEIIRFSIVVNDTKFIKIIDYIMECKYIDMRYKLIMLSWFMSTKLPLLKEVISKLSSDDKLSLFNEFLSTV
jgi:hypothetical protein